MGLAPEFTHTTKDVRQSIWMEKAIDRAVRWGLRRLHSFLLSQRLSLFVENHFPKEPVLKGNQQNHQIGYGHTGHGRQ
jgi:hypothetical protein